MIKINTTQLAGLALLSESNIEATATKGVANFTHFIEWYDDKLHDEGIDGEVYKYSIDEFMEDYDDYTWWVDLIEVTNNSELLSNVVRDL